MYPVFYVAGLVALISSILVVTRRNPVHALLYFILSLIAIAVIFFDVGAPFVAVLEIIIYAGAIMVLFIFVVMLLSPGAASVLKARDWLGPALLSLFLTAGIVYSVVASPLKATLVPITTPRDVAVGLFGPFLLGVELSSLLLLAGLVAAFHVGRKGRVDEPPARHAEPLSASHSGKGNP